MFSFNNMLLNVVFQLKVFQRHLDFSVVNNKTKCYLGLINIYLLNYFEFEFSNNRSDTDNFKDYIQKWLLESNLFHKNDHFTIYIFTFDIIDDISKFNFDLIIDEINHYLLFNGDRIKDNDFFTIFNKMKQNFIKIGDYDRDEYEFIDDSNINNPSFDNMITDTFRLSKIKDADNKISLYKFIIQKYKNSFENIEDIFLAKYATQLCRKYRYLNIENFNSIKFNFVVFKIFKEYINDTFIIIINVKSIYGDNEYVVKRILYDNKYYNRPDDYKYVNFDFLDKTKSSEFIDYIIPDLI